MMNNVMLLMRNTLEDNEISPERLHASLGKFISAMHQFVNIKFTDNELEALLAKDVIDSAEGFMALLELGELVHKACEKRF